ncbi:hypothetical protein HRR83_002758 [Exophiala dermatitidis]|nr:hypothetical protein HRR74_003809 [Exophiala dermatitidis]KAJ4521951.1 hypothetical protein HRR73_003150 [Exophiala dermatitidis]KAJ4537541.1 hypothetical protein HRR76_005535 [Exophiala dermatitidis]KAJ4572665.1 hypothetical protein HRR81_005105 [Exophiala dermatitidis]KAJ4596895.1 hypothetical protein HRR84_004906 [Exophiala dermatitidis]
MVEDRLLHGILGPGRTPPDCIYTVCQTFGEKDVCPVLQTEALLNIRHIRLRRFEDSTSMYLILVARWNLAFLSSTTHRATGFNTDMGELRGLVHSFSFVTLFTTA